MKRIVKQLFILFGGAFILRKTNPTPRILFWHGISKNVYNNVEQEIFSEKVFIKQIAYLKKHYEIISIEEFYKRLSTNSFTNKEVVLTFDDGYANNLYVVAPLLNKLELPFTVFISTEHISSGDLFPTSIARIIVKGSGLSKLSIPSQKLQFDIDTTNRIDYALNTISELLKSQPINVVRDICSDLIGNISIEEWELLKKKYKNVRPMNWNEVKLLSKYATIGSHCQHHICCHSAQSHEELSNQIINSKNAIETNLNIECKYFAYPNGDYTEYSNNLVESNYILGFSTKAKERISEKTKRAIIPRIGLPANIDTFKIIMGLYPKK